MFNAVLNKFEALFGRCIHVFAEIETVEHAFQYFNFRHENFFGFLNLGNAVFIATCVGIERFLQIFAEPNIIND
ncbi:hypothetical protein D3C73_692690 [compost metagenome]